MKKLKIWWAKVWCLHYWIKGFEIDVMYGRGYLYPYTCKKCNKVIHRWSDEPPISYVEPEL